MNNMYEYEENLYKEGYNFIAGTDEAGRGPLVGPVVAGCVVFPKGYKNDLINDSKKLTEKKREQLYDIIIKDVMTRKKIQDETMLRNVANFAMDNIGNLVSTNNIANTMISNGKDINVRTIEKYLEGFTESFFLYKVSRPYPSK